jgi:glucose-6-phosphate isomerase
MAQTGSPSCADRQTGFSHLADRPDGRRISKVFPADPARVARFADRSLDFAKFVVDDTASDRLFALAQAAGLDDFRRRLFPGRPVNETEHRAAMHKALRAPGDARSAGDHAA